MSALSRLWDRWFLEERSTASLGLFRVAVAFTVGAHVFPSFLYMSDNYLSTAFKVRNPFFFPPGVLEWVAQSPDTLVWICCALTCFAVLAFAVGFNTQISAILMTAGCYYFYALNAFHIGTLSFDILLVTLSLICVSPYPGDAFSLDAAFRRRRGGEAIPKRPFFVQRLLQLQLTWTYWYTALSKVTADGNWIHGNPYFYLMNYPPMGVVRDFPLRSWLAARPDVCHALGIILIVFEFGMPLLWWFSRTRTTGILLGFAFHLMLWRTLHVPTIFLFLFPAMMLLFIPPERVEEKWTAWRESRHKT